MYAFIRAGTRRRPGCFLGAALLRSWQEGNFVTLHARGQKHIRQVGQQPDAKRPQLITLRRFVIVMISLLAAAAVWRRTGNDAVLTVVAVPLVYNALDRWISD
ncbi:hypothetical protein [Actinoplanes sp. ATCC 53533]|uniref:hypothetical protein n=1 Tax=Actinoplanes sp. ATCC 53533 TaxID=1288362 RepID=UPI000F795B71|nr:hypothetical protein [Actinoplanes sp. ATCC 53533]